MIAAELKAGTCKILVVIPCLNEEASVGGVISRALGLRSDYPRLDVLVVDDGSTDVTADRARQHGAMVLSHPTNRGVGAAFHSGVTFAIERSYELMINIDGDGQFNPEDIPKLLAHGHRRSCRYGDRLPLHGPPPSSCYAAGETHRQCDDVISHKPPGDAKIL